MMKKILLEQFSVSVVVPCFNEEKYLQSTLSSLAFADHPCVCEIIILDDRSTDSSLIIAKNASKINPKIAVISNQRNLGAVGNSNKGLSLAKGDYVHFLSANDIVLPHFYKTLNDTMKPGFRGIWSTMGIKFSTRYDGRLFRSHTLSVNSKSAKFIDPRSSSKKLIRDSWMIGQSVVYERNSLNSAGGFNEELGGFCDLVTMTEIITSYGAIFIPRPLCGIRIHSNTFLISQCTNNHSLNKIISTLKIHQSYYKSTDDKNKIYKNLQARVLFTALRPLNNPSLSSTERKRKYIENINKGHFFPKIFYRSDLLFFTVTRFQDSITLICFRFLLFSIYQKINANKVTEALEHLRDIEVSVVN